MEQDPGPALLFFETLEGRGDRLLDDVVGEDHADAVAADEALRQAQGLGDPACLLLVRIGEEVDPVFVPVPEQPEEFACVSPAGDEHHLPHACAYECLNGIRDHRPVVDGKQVLVSNQGERVQARTSPAGEDHAFHGAGESKAAPADAARANSIS